MATSSISEASPPLIVLENVGYRYDRGGVATTALQGITFTIRQGEFVAIVGASGSGKTTLMNILGCMDVPSEGRYLLLGQDVASLSEDARADLRNRTFGFVFQNFNLLPRISAFENACLPLVYAGRLAGGEDRVRSVFHRLGIGERFGHTPAQLSGGQQQRVALARALANDPRIILADEPTGQLDSRSSAELMAILHELHEREGRTIVLVTHNPALAETAERVLSLADGRLVSDRPGQSCAARTPTTAETTIVPFPSSESTESSLGRKAWSIALMTLKSAAGALRRNVLRSALTVLGIFIGVAAFVVMVAVGRGAREQVARELQALGTNMLIVLPGSFMQFGANGGAGTLATLTVDDARLIRRDDPAVLRVSYLVRSSGTVTYRNLSWTTTIQGVSPSYLAVRSWPLASGRNLTPRDDRDMRRVCVLGQTVVQQLFPNGVSPLGHVIDVRGVPLRVVGVLTPLGQSGFGVDQDDVVLLPYTTAQTMVLGAMNVPPLPSPTVPPGTHFIVPQDIPQNLYASVIPNPLDLTPHIQNLVNLLLVQARSSKLVPVAMQEVTRTLRRANHLTGQTPNNFTVRNLSQIVQVREQSSRVLTLLLAFVASVALIVGGIGIMNILLVSVTERTREIGVRKAVGAHERHILYQFLVEAVMLAVVGGLAGLAAAFILVAALARIFHWTHPLSIGSVIFAFSFAAAVGIFFGYYPARKAARLNPGEALRYE